MKTAMKFGVGVVAGFLIIDLVYELGAQKGVAREKTRILLWLEGETESRFVNKMRQFVELKRGQAR